MSPSYEKRVAANAARDDEIVIEWCDENGSEDTCKLSSFRTTYFLPYIATMKLADVKTLANE
jgi:hypothetical protein